MRMPLAKRLIVGLATLSVALGAHGSQGRYIEKAEFLLSVFGESEFEQAAVFVDASLRESIENVLGRRFPLLRVRYWRAGSMTAWVFDEIGKEEPITIGIGIDNDSIATVRILEFRESRGWEVRYPFFTDQFAGARLAENTSIDRDIDGITGATLSVSAVNRAVRLALFLHAHVESLESERPASRS